MNTKPLNVLVFTTSFPSLVQPEFGVHVKERLRVLSKSSDMKLRIVAPAPYFPKVKLFKRWYAWSQVPSDEIVDGLAVYRPRYVMLPKIGGYIHDRLIYRASLKYIENLQKQFDFDLIDSHFAYPSGSAAVMLGQRFGKPVVITCRGADIAVYPNQRFLGDRVRYALRNADQLVALSQEMRGRMIALGADDTRITTIPNGVDLTKFDSIERNEARTKLGLPLDRPIILSVGYRLELKGFHILVDALAELRKTYPNAMVAIVGGQARWAPDYLPEISQRIQEHRLEGHVILAGTRPQEELKYWNSAADLCCILSSREGSPNVMMEALACGTPLISTRVGNVPEILQSPTLGSIIEARTAQAASQSLCEALSRTWNRETIRAFAMTHSWTQVASQVEQVFLKAASK